MIFCARATRGLRRIGRERPDRPSCSQNAHDKNCARPMRAVKDSLATPLTGNEENRKALARANGTSREIDCEAIGG